MCLYNFSGAFIFFIYFLISQQFLSNFFFLLIYNPTLVMCIWYECSILSMIFIFWSFHGYYIRKEKNLCFSGVCQPNQNLFRDYLPVWGNSNLIFSQCPWCISSYGCSLLWTQCTHKVAQYGYLTHLLKDGAKVKTFLRLTHLVFYTPYIKVGILNSDTFPELLTLNMACSHI